MENVKKQKRRKKKINTFVNEKSILDAGVTLSGYSGDQLDYTKSDLNRNLQKPSTSQSGGNHQENDDQVLMPEKTKFWKVICPVGQEWSTFNLLRDKIADSLYSDKPIQVKSIISPSEQVRGHVIVEASKREHVEEAIKEFNNLILEDNQQGMLSMKNEQSGKQQLNQTPPTTIKLNQQVRSKRKALSEFNQEIDMINQKKSRQNALTRKSKKKESTYNHLINLDFNKSTKQILKTLKKNSKQTQTDIDSEALERINQEIRFLREVFVKNPQSTNQDFVTELSTTQPLTINDSTKQLLDTLSENSKSTQTKIQSKTLDELNQEIIMLREKFIKNRKSTNQDYVDDFLSLPTVEVLKNRLKQLKLILTSNDLRQSFVYLIIDPDLYKIYVDNQCLTTFLAMIIYIGSGSICRLVDHFQILKKCYDEEISVDDTEMLRLYKRLLDIWNSEKNIIVLHNIANEPLFKPMSDCIERLLIEPVKLINPDGCVNIAINEYYHHDLSWTSFRWYRIILGLHILKETIDNNETKFIEVPPGHVIEQTTEIEKFKCEWTGCDFENIHHWRMKEHMRSHTGEKPFKCDWSKCDYKTGSSTDFTVHKRRHFGEKPHKCNFQGCDRAFSASTELTVHKRTHTGEKPYKCDFQKCPKTFSISKNLTNHQRTHTGEKPYKCDFQKCPRAFSLSKNLTVHLRTHTGEKPFVCDFQGCDYKTGRPGDLIEHKRIHSGQKPYACDFKKCQFAFRTSSKLTIHKRTHTGEKPYKCDFQGCQRAFSSSSSLTQHKLKHTGVKKHVCDVEGCNYKTSKSSNLTKHKRTHTGEKPYECDFHGCQQAFSSSTDLTIHKRTHTGEKPYKCDFQGCQRAFSSSSSLTQHKLKHTGVKKHVCDVEGCNYKTSKSSNLTKHKRTHTK